MPAWADLAGPVSRLPDDIRQVARHVETYITSIDHLHPVRGAARINFLEGRAWRAIMSVQADFCAMHEAANQQREALSETGEVQGREFITSANISEMKQHIKFYWRAFNLKAEEFRRRNGQAAPLEALKWVDNPAHAEERSLDSDIFKFGPLPDVDLGEDEASLAKQRGDLAEKAYQYMLRDGWSK